MRKTILLIFGVIILQLNFSCKSQYSETELKDNFSTEQISDLNEISIFFKNQMCLNMDSDFRTCYERIPHEYLEATGSGFWTNINFEKQQELYEQISKSTFSEIWTFCKSTEYKTGFETKNICPVVNGKYQKYLTEIGETNPSIAEYAKHIRNSGDFSVKGIRYWKVLNKKKYYDLKDPNIQLILAIHYLSLNDQERRNEKWIPQ